MTVEPSQAYTIFIRKVMPPRPAPVIPMPKLSMAEEAAQVRARFRRTWGPQDSRASGEEANAKSKMAAEARRDELIAKAMELLSKQELTSGQMRDICHASENQMRNALGYMRAQGMADFSRKGSIVVWHRVEVAAE